MPVTRDRVFDRLTVDHLVAGSTRVSWSLRPGFFDAEPYSFQLQVGFSGHNDADDWEDVGDAVDGATYAVDDERRLYGKTWDTCYRVVLVTPGGTYTSEPAASYGILPPRDWRLAADIIRKRKLLYRKYTGWEGWLLRRLRRGETPDPADLTVAVTDPLTGEILVTQAPETMTTEFTGGFFTPFVTQMQLSQEQWFPQRSEATGTVNPVVQMAEAIPFPRIEHGDVFVHKHSDRRYFVRPVRVAAQHRGVPLVLQVELRLLPTTSVVYAIEMPE